MILTREEALSYHRQMWSDMQRDLGNCPTELEREQYKRYWCETYFPNKRILYNCFLCEYAKAVSCGFLCNYCPIKWDWGLCFAGDNEKKSYRNMPISELLALPEEGER